MFNEIEKFDISECLGKMYVLLYCTSGNHYVYLQGENPIYKQATSTFKNPTYAGKSC